MSIKKIIVTGDFLRIDAYGAFCQRSNIAWLYHLIQPLLRELARNIPIEMFSPENREKTASFIVSYYAATGLDPALDNWIRLYGRSPNMRQMALLELAFADSFVIGFELAPAITKALTYMGAPWIDFAIHPARFLPDLAFGARSNIPGLKKALFPWRLTDSSIRVAGGYALARLVRFPRLPECESGKNIAIFTCQTAHDRVLIKDGRMDVIENHLEAIKNILSKHDRILIKPHPSEPSSHPELLLDHLVPDATVTTNNFYHLVSHDNVTSVYSVASSTTFEARWLGKNGVHLGSYPFVFSESEISTEHYLAFSGGIYQQNFWRNILDALHIPARSAGISEYNINLRQSLNEWWGADILF